MPLFALVAVSIVITILAQSHGGAVRTFAKTCLLDSAFQTGLLSYVKYILLTFWPNNLAVYYPLHSDGHTRLADNRRSVPADWNYGVFVFSTKKSAVPHRGLALVSRNIGSCYRIRSGRRANHGGPVLLYSVDRFVHCDSVRISGHRQELACCAAAQRRNSWRGSTDPCHSHERTDSSLA